MMRKTLSPLLFFTVTPSSRCQLSLAFKISTHQLSTTAHRRPQQRLVRKQSPSHASIYRTPPWQLASDNDDSPTPLTAVEDTGRRVVASPIKKSEILVNSGKDDTTSSATTTKAATSTVNERLLSEIQASVEKEKYGSGKSRQYFKEFQSQKTEEERRRSIEEARDLNGEWNYLRLREQMETTKLGSFIHIQIFPSIPAPGVNPLVCIGGAAFAWACAGALWFATTYLGVLFTSHPLDTDMYFAQRLADVFRSAVMGLVSLASGFFGVVGIGIFLLGIRVAYGVMTGELDPTPIKQPKSEEIVLPDVWGLMMGKNNNRRRKR